MDVHSTYVHASHQPHMSALDNFRAFDARERVNAARHGVAPSSRAQKLDSLFAAPAYIFPGTFQQVNRRLSSPCMKADTDPWQASLRGQQDKAWVLVNIQKMDEFDCHKLNRDTWSSADVTGVILDGFVFWQVRAWAIAAAV